MKKSFNVLLICCCALLFFPIVYQIKCAIYQFPSAQSFATDPEFYSRVILRGIEDVLCAVICIFVLVVLIFFLVHFNRAEIKSVAIDFKKRRAEKKKLKDAAKREKLQKQLDELNTDGK